jgi:antitoxin ParD1/3/4
VMREALREWKFRRGQRERAVEELRMLIQEGIDSGPPEDADIVFDRLLAEFDAKHPE